MTDTTFVDKTTQIVSSWLNDVNVTVYRALGSGGVAPTTAAAVRTNLSVYSHADLIAAAGAGYIGFDQSSTYPAGTVGLSLQRFISITDAPYSADSTGAVDCTTVVQNAITAVEAGASAGGVVYFPKGTYKFSGALTILNATSLIGEKGATTFNCTQTTVSAIICGSSTTVWNGYHSFIEGIAFSGAVGGNSSCHGVEVKAKLTTIRDCTFTGFIGSGIKGTFTQYLQAFRCGFSNNGRYGIELLTADYNAGLTGDVYLSDIYQNINNGLGGIFFQGANSLLERITGTADTGAVCTDALVNLQGYNNVIDSGTFEITTLSAKTMLRVTAVAFAISNVIKSCYFSSDALNTPIALATLTGLKLSDILINMSAGVTSTHIVRADGEGTLTSAVYFDRCTKSNPAPWINARQNCWFSDPQESYLTNQAATSGSGPYFFTYNTVVLPCWGYWEVTVLSFQTSNPSIRCVHVSRVYYDVEFSTFESIGTEIGNGGQTNSDLAAVNGTNGTLTVTCANSSSNNHITIVTTAKQIGFSE